MFLLGLKNHDTKCRLNNRSYLFQASAINPPLFSVVGGVSTFKIFCIYSNLKLFPRNVNLNVLNFVIRAYTKMNGKGRARGFTSSSVDYSKLITKKSETSSSSTNNNQRRKLDVNNCKLAVLSHLRKDPRFTPLLQSSNQNVAENQRAMTTTMSSRHQNDACVLNEITTRLNRQDYFQRFVLNSLGIDPKKYQISEKPYSASLMSDYDPFKENTVSDNECVATNFDFLPSFDSDLYCNIRKINDNPKVTLHNFYQKVANELNSNLYDLEPPMYNYKQNMWHCMYKISWPISTHFIGEAMGKKGASHISAKSAVDWLRKNNVMDDFGKPILIHNIKGRSKLNAGLLQPKASVLGNRICFYTTSSKTDIKDKPENRLETLTKANEDIKNIKSLYPVPKNTLHNVFQILSNELKQTNLKLIPQYKPIKQKSCTFWMCTYNLKWPELMTFSEVAHTKQEASYKTALLALQWLTENKKITKDGKPLIYDKTEMKKITKQSYPTLTISNSVCKKMRQIEDVFKSNLVNQLVTDLDNGEGGAKEEMEQLEEQWPETNANQRRQEFMGLQFYEAKEPTKLPISDYKNQIIEALQKHQVVIIKGEPGCGKSTRVPQYVLEAWSRENDGQPCRVVVTQPRRIAAISLAERVASEREESVGNTVGFHVRLNSNFNNRTGHIMYCTTGILLRRLQQDPKISDCSHIILDEAHERDVNTDLLMNLVRHALNVNPNLKLLVMSATLEAKLFQNYFNDAPILNIPGFTYPVKEHFLTESKNLPKTYEMCAGKVPTVIPEEVVQIIEHIHKRRPEGAILCFLPGWDEIMKVYKLIPESNDLYVLCLHSKLDISEQRKIFNRPPPGVRKVILATNIAETSITIDDVVYVVDTGIHKEERFDVEKGVNCIDNYWISQASTVQRKGRAGRCQPGESYHLYPQIKYNEFQPHSIPEILRTSLTKIVLDSKVYSNNMNAVEFLEQLICPPDKGAVEKAVEELKELELLDENENLTPLGRTLSEFQLAPKLSKAMVNSVIFKCVTPIIDIATLFSADSPIFSKTLGGLPEIKDVKRQFSKNSDHLSLMRMYEMWLDYIEERKFDSANRFCYDKGLMQPKLKVIKKLSEIHSDYLRKGLKNVLPLADDFSDNDELVKAVLLSGVGNVLQHRSWDIVKGRMKKTNVLITKRNQKATITTESVNSRRGKFPSDFLLYINETLSNLRHTTIVRETSVISALAVLLFKTGQLEIEEVPKENYSQNIHSDDQVLLKLENTKIEILCDRTQAVAIKKCKEILQECVQYYIFQLTRGEDYNEQVNFYWNEILRHLNDILISQKLNDDLDNM